MNIPAQIVAGDNVTWQDVSQTGDLSATVDSGAYTLTYALRGAASLDIVGTGNGTGWQFAIVPADTTAFAAGVYYWQATATKGAERLTLGQGTLQVLQNIAAQTGAYDGRSLAEQDLAAVETEIRVRITGGASLEYTIGNRSLKREPLSALREMRAEFLRICVKQRQLQSIAQGKGNPRQMFVSFGSPKLPRP